MSFWTQDPYILFSAQNRFDIVPSAAYSDVENLNRLSRLIVWMALALLLVSGNVFALLFGAAFLALIVLIFESSVREKIEELPAADPTLNNPYCNPLFGDIPKAEAPKWSEPKNAELLRKATELATYNVYTDQDDLYGKNNIERVFHSIPSTTTPYDQELDFRKFLQLTPNKKSCKQDPRSCQIFQDLRFQPSVVPNQPVKSMY